MLTPLPLQTTYQQYETVAQVGMPASMTGWDADNRIAEDLGSGIPFGRAVCQGTASDKAATLGQLSGGEFIGITMADDTLPLSTTRPVDTFEDTDNMAVLVRGDIWVAPVGTVAAGAQVYYNSVTGQLGPSGISNAVLITHGRWETSSPNTSQPLVNFNGLAVVRLGASAQ
jgi:hypothetical protein